MVEMLAWAVFASSAILITFSDAIGCELEKGNTVNWKTCDVHRCTLVHHGAILRYHLLHDQFTWILHVAVQRQFLQVGQLKEEAWMSCLFQVNKAVAWLG